MKKIILILSFLLLVSCGYQPIFSSKTSNFLIEEIIYNENDKESLKIRNNLTKVAKDKKFHSIFPPINLCGDNAAMIAWAGIERHKIQLIDDLEFPSRARWPLDNTAPFLKGPGLKI